MNEKMLAAPKSLCFLSLRFHSTDKSKSHLIEICVMDKG